MPPKSNLGSWSCFLAGEQCGNVERHRADEISVEYWDDRIAVNLRHQFFAAREVARGMKELGGGSIINFGSVQAYLSSPGMSFYAVYKYGFEE